MKLDDEVVTSARLSALKPALQEWISVINETAHAWHGPTDKDSDIPF